MSSIEQRWYSANPGWLWILWPLEWLFACVVFWRRQYFLLSRARRYRSPVPLVVIGNVSVGGTGKTPLVVALVEYLRSRGWRPGIVSRGYGGSGPFPRVVRADSSPAECGDEPVLLARRCGCPLVVAPKRVQAVSSLIERFPEVDVIISDDGLQHYALDRDVEVVVVDGQRRLGNGHLMPLGPLREPSWRLGEADFVVQNGGSEPFRSGAYLMRLKAGAARAVDGGNVTVSGTGKVAAFAGIGCPERFFNTLKVLGYSVEPHPMPDHHAYTQADFSGVSLPVMMTEKDAVKCRGISPEGAAYIPVEALLPLDFLESLDEKLRQCRSGS